MRVHPPKNDESYGSRTLFLVKDFPPDVGGVQGLLGQLAARWPGDVHVIACGTPGDTEHDSSYPVEVTRVSSFRSLPGFAAIIMRQLAFLVAVYRLWRRWPFERVICGYLQFSGPIASIWDRFFAVPYVIMTYGTELMRVRRSPLTGFWRRLLTRAELVTTIAEPFSEFISEFAPGARVNKIPVGCVISMRAERHLPEPFRGHALRGKRVILSVGRLVPRKGFDTLLEAVAGLVPKYEDLVCVVVGEGHDETRLRSLAVDLGIADRVIFTGKVSDMELAQLYERADLFALISRQEGDDVEGFGIVFIEAGARGLPVVGGRSGGVSEAVRDGVSGFLADPLDPVDVAVRIASILDDPWMAERMGEEGRRLASEVHTFENMANILTGNLGRSG